MSDPIASVVAGAAQGVLGGIRGIVKTIWGDKSEEEQEAATIALTKVANAHAEAMSQVAVDQAEAASPDKWNHWRGGLGWICDAAIAWNYILQPMCQYWQAVGVAHGWWAALPTLPPISEMHVSELMQLVLLMLGSHAVPIVTGVFKK